MPQLNRELAHAAAQGGEIFVTWASQVYADFAVNWARSLQRVNATNFLVGALDEKAAQVREEAECEGGKGMWGGKDGDDHAGALWGPVITGRGVGRSFQGV